MAEQQCHRVGYYWSSISSHSCWKCQCLKKSVFAKNRQVSMGYRSKGATISNTIVGTFPCLTPYFVIVIPFCPPSLLFQPPSPLNNVVLQLLLSWGTNKQHWIGERGLFHNFFRDKKSGVIWWTKSAMERQFVNCSVVISPIIGDAGAS